MPKQNPLKPLSDIHPEWGGSVVESFHARIKERAEELTLQMKQSRFLVFAIEERMSYDSYNVYVPTLELFSTLEEAQEYANDWIAKAIPRVLQEQSSSYQSWEHLAEYDNKAFWQGSPQKELEPKLVLSFVAEADPTYYWRRFQLEALALHGSNLTAAVLFNYFDDVQAWTHFFTHH